MISIKLKWTIGDRRKQRDEFRASFNPAFCGRKIIFATEQISCHRRSPLPRVPFSILRDSLQQQLPAFVEDKYVGYAKASFNREYAASWDRPDRPIMVIDLVDYHVVSKDWHERFGDMIIIMRQL